MTDKIKQICENYQCKNIESKPDELIYVIEIEVSGIDLTDLNVTQIQCTISDMTGIDLDKLRIGVDTNDKDEIVSILVIVNDKTKAEDIRNSINELNCADLSAIR